MSGIAIIVGIIVVAIIGGFVLHALFIRYGRSRQDAEYRPHQRGRIGRRT
jgi:predicted RND superfamily exporter protein